MQVNQMSLDRTLSLKTGVLREATKKRDQAFQEAMESVLDAFEAQNETIRALQERAMWLSAEVDAKEEKIVEENFDPVHRFLYFITVKELPKLKETIEKTQNVVSRFCEKVNKIRPSLKYFEQWIATSNLKTEPVHSFEQLKSDMSEIERIKAEFNGI